MIIIGRAVRDRSLWLVRWISVSVNGKRFAALWGNGDHGRLGHGSLESRWTPNALPSSLFDNQTLRQIACGGAHTLFLTEHGRVYASGLNDYGQLGVSDDRAYITEPLGVAGLPKEIVKVSAGYHHSSAITVDGELYMWGKNTNGQLGLGKKAATVLSIPNKVECLNGVTIKIISLGFEHSIAVTDKGETLSWGGGQSGRLGHGHQSGIFGLLKSDSEYTPRLIKELEGLKVKNVAAGMLHSVCISENGSVHIFGERANKKLGYSEASNNSVPSMVDGLPYSEKAACGGYHTCVITGGGELYVWGTNENGCLGIGSTDVAHLPERVEGPFLRHSVSEVSCGWKHTAAISGGNVYTWGWGGSHGTFSVDGHSSGRQLGQGNDVDYIEPTKINFHRHVKALQVSCGFNHTGGGELYVWGTNENGCLGIGSTDVAHLPERVEGPFLRHSVSEVSCGWKHTAAISGGNVYTWGWGGSHGTFSVDGHSSGRQLGQGNDVDYIEPTKINFHRHVKALQVSCGFNHTGAIFEYS